MSNMKAIQYYLIAEGLKDPDKYFKAKDVACEIGLSLDRTRRHLSRLTFEGVLDTKVDGWANTYRIKKVA